MLRDQVRTTNTLSINEIYESIQGEGLLVGTPSVFIRFQGCNLRCPWCDQPSALSFREATYSQEEVIERVKSSPFRHVVITGGEPFAHKGLFPLVKKLLEEGFSVQIETNGTRWVEGIEEVAERLHITCSPKAVADFFVHPKILKFAKELKFVVDGALSLKILLKKEFLPFLESQRVVLQPESNRSEALEKALFFQRELAGRGFTVRVIPQVHKFLGLK